MMPISQPIRVPEQGQIVTVRQRRYTVVDVLPSMLPPSPLGGQAVLQHLITLNSIEDDALGESLQVVWELEPGARIGEKVALPEPPAGFDPPRRLDAFLDAVRWGAIASADVKALQAPFRFGGNVTTKNLIVFVFANSRHFAILQSTFHNHWAWRYSSTLKQDLNYAPTDVTEGV